LALLASYKAEWPCLIIAPSSLTGQWRGLCLEWLAIDGLSEGDIRWVRKGAEPLDGRINIISYDLAVNKEQELSVRNFQVILCDESHKLKSRTSRRTKALLPFLKNARRTILMSGTPALSRPSELFTQLSLLRPDIFHSFHEFGVRYCEGKKAHFGWQYEGASNLQELHIILETLCMIRRTKDEVLELPPKSRERVALTLAPEQVQLVDKSVEQLRKVTEKAKEKFVDPVTQKAAFLSVWRDTGRAKCPSIIEYIHHLLQQGEKFLVFAHHKFVLDELETFLSRNTTSFIRIDGTTPQNHRTRQADAFQDNPEIRVALLSIMAAGTGLTLTAANIVVFAELLFTPGDILQAEDRCHRISQVRPVSVRFLIAQGTPDERIWWMLNRKLQVLGNIYGKDKMALHATQTAFEDEVPDMRDFIAAILGHDVVTETLSTTTNDEQQKPIWNSGLVRDRFTKTSGSASGPASTLTMSEVTLSPPPKQEVITQFFEAAPEKKRRRANPLQNTAPPVEMWGAGTALPLRQASPAEF
jgi:SWI/SNF-related matrix-associated actin-dependent regulator 1 of chromatin subfamily A